MFVTPFTVVMSNDTFLEMQVKDNVYQLQSEWFSGVWTSISTLNRPAHRWVFPDGTDTDSQIEKDKKL